MVWVNEWIVGSTIQSERNQKQISARSLKTGGRGWSQCTGRNIRIKKFCEVRRCDMTVCQCKTLKVRCATLNFMRTFSRKFTKPHIAEHARK